MVVHPALLLDLQILSGLPFLKKIDLVIWFMVLGAFLESTLFYILRLERAIGVFNQVCESLLHQLLPQLVVVCLQIFQVFVHYFLQVFFRHVLYKH
jgi:hypothetical protein